MKSEIHIIESPSAIDILQNRKEGTALSHALSLANISCNLYNVSDRTTFKMVAIEFIRNHKKVHLPYIHISAHASEDGMRLTSGDFISWYDLGELLHSINKVLLPENRMKELSLITLCISACEGYNAYKLQSTFNPTPYSVIIGPNDPIDWIDSLTAFISFYNQILHRNKRGPESVKVMNDSINSPDAFSYQLSPEMTSKQINKSKVANNAPNHDRPHLQTPLIRGRLVLQDILVVCGVKMRS